MADDAHREQLAGVTQITAALDGADEERRIHLLLVRDGELAGPARSLVTRCEAIGIPVRRAAEREMRRFSAEPGRVEEVLALAGASPAPDEAELYQRGGALWLVTGVAYPGNAGFAIRTAEVSGASGIVVDADFDHAGRRQAGRASMRADRFFPVRFSPGERAVALARAASAKIVGIENSGTVAPWETDLTGSVVFIVGGEAEGVGAPLLEACDVIVRIPMAGFIPSYNLQAAIAIVAGERLRQISAGNSPP